MRTSELTGSALDWAVAKCEEGEELAEGWHPHTWKRGLRAVPYAPSTDWAQGGPIIEREKIAVWFHTEYGCWCAAGIEWMDADVESNEFMDMPDAFRGPTPLIAAMRCYVASKLGDTIDIPEELQ